MLYKLLVLDVDGTIIPYGMSALPSFRVTEAIKKAGEKLTICLATGRPYFLLTKIFDHLNLSGFAIINDGAQLIDIQTRKLYYERVMDPEIVSHICRIIHRAGIPFYIHDNGKDLLYTPDYIPNRPYNILTLQEHEEEKIDKLVTLISYLPSIKINKTHGAENHGLLISHASATKLHGIYEVSRILRIKKEEIIGIGDSGNDFPLLMASGLKVAMGNAIEDLKEIADHVAPSVEEDGVAHVIEKFILNSS
ncbi:MAG: HAD family phosphatase [Candidatus Levybacteria bacterium]|nr:HAD family phosphatase [Candidatus Levybacteria bacterium]